MDNNKKIFEGLLKADGIDPAGSTESEHIAFKKMLDEQSKSKQSKPDPRPDIWRIIMKSKMTKFAAAAIMIIAIIVGVKNKYTQRADIKKEDMVFTASLFGELKRIRQMAAANDVSGLVKVLSTGPLECKLVAASSLNKIMDISAFDMLTMHVAGDIVIDRQQGKLRLYSTKSEDWLEVTKGMFVVHIDNAFRTSQQVRLTHDVSGDFDAWTKRQAEFESMRHEQVVLKEELSSQDEVGSMTNDELKERLTEVNRMIDFMDRAIYATIDQSGRLSLKSPLHKQQASAELCDGKVRVESSQGHIVEADSVTLLFALRPVRTDGPPLPTTDWRIRFDQMYSLDDKEVLRWIRTPFIPERQIYATQELHYYSGTDNPPPPGYLSFRWNGKLRNWSLGMFKCSLDMVLMEIGLKRYQYNDGPEELGKIELGGDWVLRDNVTIENRLLALEKIFQNELGRKIKFEKREVNRDTIIVRGQYKQVPLEGVGRPNNIYIYPDSWDDFKGPEPISGGSSNSNVAKLIEKVGSKFNRPIIFETENLSDITVSYFYSQSYGLATCNTKTKEGRQKILDSVLKNLSIQTSLQFEYGQHDAEVWFITEDN